MPTPRKPLPLRAALLAIGAAALQAGASATGASGAIQDAAQRPALPVSPGHGEPAAGAGARYRSPATIDAELAEDLARRLHRRPEPGAATAGLRLTAVSDAGAALPTHVAVPISYDAAPMAIMRADTSIRSWEQLKGRAVCVARDGRHVGALAGRYGAIEKIQPSLTDALVALRSGACDAAVHDSAMLEELIRLPEWKKFSARLPAVRQSTLAVLVPASDGKTLTAVRQAAHAWKAEGYPDTLMKKAVRNVAFEVYLEQDVPDCH